MTQNKLKKLFIYDEVSGIFIRNKTNSKRWKKGQVAGTINTQGYLCIRIDGKLYLCHRLAWLYVYGDMPDGHIDHINHNRSDNRIENLRVVDNSENNKNRSNYSGCVFGVSWCTSRKNRPHRWRARIHVDGKDTHLGYFVEYSQAVNARKNAEILYGFHKNHGQEVSHHSRKL